MAKRNKKFFAYCTICNCIIGGRKTFEDFEMALKNHKNWHKARGEKISIRALLEH